MKNLIILFTILFLITDVAYCWELYNPSSYVYYSIGRYENLSRRKTKFYKTGVEYNKDNAKTYYCMIPDNSDTGYLLERSPVLKSVGYVWNYSYLNAERQRCHRTLDTYPIVKSFKEAAEYKN